MNSNRLLESLNIGGLKLGNNAKNETQKLILKSELVLLPVFEFVKNEYRKKGKDVSEMELKGWIKNELKIDYEKDSFESIIEKIEYAIEQHSSFLKVIPKEQLEEYESINKKREF